MAYNPITSTEIQVKQPVRQELMQKVKDNFDYFYGLAGDTYGNIYNGSFEIDSDNDAVPDGWTRQLYPNGTGRYETANPAHGSKAYKFTHPGGVGNGGGYLESDYIPVHQLNAYVLDFIHWCSVATIKNKVSVRYFDKDKVYLSEAELYSSTSNPTSATQFKFQFTPPANTRYARICCIGGFTDTNVAGDAYFDCVNIYPKLFQTVITTGQVTNLAWLTSWIIPAGLYNITSNMGSYLQLYISGSWTGGNKSVASGLVCSDGINQRIYNGTGGYDQIYWQRVDNY